ncbi:hypothetical protein T09_7530 [Trichinella sp. T9]|nr:hypothetical protein T09_7530 [Trichinella sp. T9]
MHKYAVIALPFIFSNLRCFREKNLHNNAILRSNMNLAINYHKAQTNVEVSCQAAYPLEQPLTIIMSTLRTLICDASVKNICITMPYYVCAITDGKLGTSDAEDEGIK